MPDPEPTPAAPPAAEHAPDVAPEATFGLVSTPPAGATAEPSKPSLELVVADLITVLHDLRDRISVIESHIAALKARNVLANQP